MVERQTPIARSTVLDARSGGSFILRQVNGENGEAPVIRVWRVATRDYDSAPWKLPQRRKLAPLI